jgi:hypothetical protein
MYRIRMVIVQSVLSTALMIGVCDQAFAQHSPQHVPGRVGGSTNSPQVRRPTTSPAARSAPPPPIAGEDQAEFDAASKDLPNLTSTEFARLRFLSTNLQTMGKKDIAVLDLAKRLSNRHGDVVAALRDSGLSKSEAKDLFHQALTQIK